MPYGEEAYIGVGNRAVGHGYTYGDSTRQKFTGYERDEETDLDFAQARMHNYNHGRFTSVDPIFISEKRISDPQAVNLYIYVRNNPWKYTDPDGRKFVDENGRKIKVKWNKKTKQFEIKAHKKTDPNSKAVNDLKRMAKLVSESGSGTAVAKMKAIARNKTKVHFKIENERVGEPSLRGVHEAHDKDGNKSSWDSSTGKFDKKPAYNGNNYEEATITIFERVIENAVNDGEIQTRFGDPNITKSEAMVSVFSHEAEHNLNKKDIAEIKGRYEGKGRNYDVDDWNGAAYSVSKRVFSEIP